MDEEIKKKDKAATKGLDVIFWKTVIVRLIIITLIACIAAVVYVMLNYEKIMNTGNYQSWFSHIIDQSWRFLSDLFRK